jgi:hypothetical protein
VGVPFALIVVTGAVGLVTHFAATRWEDRRDDAALDYTDGLTGDAVPSGPEPAQETPADVRAGTDTIAGRREAPGPARREA